MILLKSAPVRSLLVLSFALVFSSAWASDTRLTQLLDTAVANHPSVNQARSQAKAAGFDVQGALWGRYPSFTTELRSDTGTTQSVAKLEQPLWTGGRITAQIQLSESAERAALAGVQEAQVNVLAQVVTHFFESLRLESRLFSAQLNVEEHQRLKNLIDRRVTAEISPVADATLAQARLLQAVNERIQIERQLDTTRTSLAQWSGVEPGRLVAPKEVFMGQLGSPDGMLDKALKASAQRQRLQHQMDSSQAQIELNRSRSYPALVAGYQQAWRGNVAPGADRNQAYLSLQFQSGAGLSALASTEAAVSKKEAVRQEIETLERNLTAQLRAGRNDVASFQDQLGPATELLGETTEVVASYLRQYQIGRKNWLDVLNAQKENTQAQYNQADMKFGYLLAQTRLLLLTGDLNPQQLTAIHDQ